MNLAKFQRRRYTEGKTPLMKLPRLTELLGGPTIYMKRDDLLGLAAGGNKTRKLEFLMADALAKGADTIITAGALQSNHCRLTLAAASKEGLKCRLVLGEVIEGSYNPRANGNNFLFQLMGVEQTKVVPGSSDMMKEMEQVAEDVKLSGGVPYIIPVGGSNEIGATGYVACAQEIMEQAFDLGININYVITTTGSTGTHAGLVTGFYGLNSNIPVIGISVIQKKEIAEDSVCRLADKTAEHVGIGRGIGIGSKGIIPREAVVCYDEYIGEGYSIPTDAMVEAVMMLARTEGILLDPVYTGKAMSGLIDLIRKGTFQKNDNLLFLHTGGSSALYNYTPVFWDQMEIK